MNSIEWTAQQVTREIRTGPPDHRLETHAVVMRIISTHGHCSADMLAADTGATIQLARERLSRAARRLKLVVVGTRPGPSNNGQRIKLWGVGK
jgi:hypothetical protein